MPSKQSEAVRRRWEAARLAMAGEGEAPDDESWGDLTAEPREVDYTEVEAGGRPAMWLVPKRARTDRVLLCLHGDETLLDDARSLDEHARKAGLDTRLDVYPGMLHTFQMAAGRAPEADDAIRQMAAWVRPRLDL